MKEHLEKPIILIIDDNPEFHQNLVFAFSEYTLISTYEEVGAKEVVSHINVDMVLSDINLDDLDDSPKKFDRGRALISWIRKKKTEIPIIAITSYYEKKEEIEANNKFNATALLFKKDYDKKDWSETFEKYLNPK